jgi:polyisoprenyl-teichoic acid--peptidoglycan teichoic acid transferase
MPGTAGSTPVTSMTMGARGRVHRAPLLLAGVLTVVVGVSGGAGVYFAADRQTNSVQRIAGPQADALADVLSANVGPAENYLIVGSDSRANGDPDGNNDTSAGCDCSDTMMILRRDPEHGASILSLPRDLWVPIAGRNGAKAKLNSAFADGPDVLARTITDNFGIPINHYLEIDLAGFIKLVDEIGGVEVCFDYASRDSGSGLDVQPGCQNLQGPMALAYARSRHLEEWRPDENGDYNWVPDNKNDLGRIERQQHFIRLAADKLLAEVTSNPLRLGDLLDAATNVITFDDSIDVLEAGRALASAAADGLQTFSVPVERYQDEGQDALLLVDGPETDAVLDYFRGTGPEPPAPDTADTSGATAT